MSETIESRLSNDPKVLAALKASLDDSVKAYVDNGLLPQSIADEITENTTGRDVLKWVLNQTESAPCIRVPTGKQIVAQRDLPPFHDNRPDCLDARICALRYSSEPAIRKDGFIKIIPTEP
jgi:hypothetical protein